MRKKKISFYKHQQCAANFSEIVKGVGMMPNKYAQVGIAVPCLATPLVN